MRCRVACADLRPCSRDDAHDAVGRGRAASHEWRKGVKYLGAQARLLRPMKPGALAGRYQSSLAPRRRALGERHDIDLFLDTMAQAPAQFGDIVTVTQLAGLARLRLARLDARPSGWARSSYAAEPQKLVARWGGW